MEITWEEIEAVEKKKRTQKALEPESWKRVISSIIEGIVSMYDEKTWDTKWADAFESIKSKNEDAEIPFSHEDIEMMYVVAKTERHDYLESLHQADLKVDRLVFMKSSELTSKPIRWLWQDKIAKGKVTLIAGDPGLGKSQTTIFIAGVVSTGGEFPGGHKCEQGKVLFFSAEDDPEDTINPRLQAVDANRENVFIFSTVRKDGKEKSFDLSKDIALLRKTVEEAGNVSLIIVDPITAFLGETDSHVNAEVRALLSMLSKIASEFGIAVVVVTHLNKSTGGSPLNKITGSLAFVAAARAAYMVIKDENDENRRLFLPVKNNLANDTGGFAFKVEGAEVGPDKIRTSKVVWEKDAISMSAVEAMKTSDGSNRHSSSGVDHKTIDRLEGILKKFPDGLTTDDFAREAMRIGISKRTLYRAEKDMMVEKVTSGKFNKKVWKLIFNDDGMINDEITADAVKKFNE